MIRACRSVARASKQDGYLPHLCVEVLATVAGNRGWMGGSVSSTRLLIPPTLPPNIGAVSVLPDRSGRLGFDSPSPALSLWPSNLHCPLGIGLFRCAINNEWKGEPYENRVRYNRETHCIHQFAGEHNLGYRDKHVVWASPIRQSTHLAMKRAKSARTTSCARFWCR